MSVTPSVLEESDEHLEGFKKVIEASRSPESMSDFVIDLQKELGILDGPKLPDTITVEMEDE